MPRRLIPLLNGLPRRRARRRSWAAFEREFWSYVEAGASHDVELRRLSALLHEGLELCEDADALLPEIRDGEGPPGLIAHRAAPVVSRLQAMRDELLAIRSPRLRALARDAETLVNFYGQHLYHALSLLTGGPDRERLRRQRERLRPVPWAQARLEAIAATVDGMLEAAA